MGKLLAIAFLVGGGWWAWQHDLVPLPAELREPTPAFAAYARFSEYLAYDQYGNARRLASHGAVRSVQIRELRGRRNTTRAISSQPLTKDDKEWARKGEIRAVAHELVSETTSRDGRTATIVALARVCWSKTGCETHQHDVEVCFAKEEWKVCNFRESEAPPVDLATR
ncbi:MAG: hypothetical protein JRH10_22940 [Deltaproteobacteria bacterium]|nr:hypothetical protein [Deltaproteobacteria bacterium]